MRLNRTVSAPNVTKNQSHIQLYMMCSIVSLVLIVCRDYQLEQVKNNWQFDMTTNIVNVCLDPQSFWVILFRIPRHVGGKATTFSLVSTTRLFISKCKFKHSLNLYAMPKFYYRIPYIFNQNKCYIYKVQKILFETLFLKHY